MKHLPTILFAILAVVFIILYLTKGTDSVPDTGAERDRLRSERDSALALVANRDKRITLLLDSLITSDSELQDNQKKIDELNNRPPYAPPLTLAAAATEWDSVFAANGIPGHAYLLYPVPK